MSTIYGRLPLAMAGAAVAVLAACARSPVTATTEVGFWFEPGPFSLPADVVKGIGSPLADAELDRIEGVARDEIAHAFAGLRVSITARHQAFWRVHVLDSLPVRFAQQLPNAGESIALGPFGGIGTVDFGVACTKAIDYAPPGTARRDIVAAIGRGVGRTAVHEFMHLMLGARAADNRRDELSYEFHSADRAAHYYGELHWTTTWDVWQQTYGR